MNVGLPHALVINLDTATERWQNFCKLAPPELSVRRLPAIAGATIGNAVTVAGTTLPKPDRLSPNEFACLASHLTAWAMIATGGETEVMVCEDDVFMPPDFGDRFARFRATLPENFDIAYLTYNTDMHLAVEIDGLGDVMIVHDAPQANPDTFAAARAYSRAYRLKRAWGLAAYLLSRAGAAKLLQRLCAQPQTVFARTELGLPNGIGYRTDVSFPAEPIDLRILSLLDSLLAYVAFPPLCLPDLAAPSTIGQRGYDANN